MTDLDHIRRLLWRNLAVLVVLLAAVWWSSYSGRWDTVHSQREGCERGKLDRTAIAKALRAQSTYLNGVLIAASVKQDVKDAARLNQWVQNQSASSLESRTGDRLDCRSAFKPPSLLPSP